MGPAPGPGLGLGLGLGLAPGLGPAPGPGLAPGPGPARGTGTGPGIQFTSSLQPQLGAIEARDAKFADQLRRSLLSVGLNLGEGYGASEGAKRRAYRVARGEAAELEMGLEMAVALGYCSLSSEQRETLAHLAGPTRS